MTREREREDGDRGSKKKKRGRKREKSQGKKGPIAGVHVLVIGLLRNPDGTRWNIKLARWEPPPPLLILLSETEFPSTRSPRLNIFVLWLGPFYGRSRDCPRIEFRPGFRGNCYSTWPLWPASGHSWKLIDGFPLFPPNLYRCHGLAVFLQFWEILNEQWLISSLPCEKCYTFEKILSGYCTFFTWLFIHSFFTGKKKNIYPLVQKVIQL